MDEVKGTEDRPRNKRGGRPTDNSLRKKKPNSFVSVFKSIRSGWGTTDKSPQNARQVEGFSALIDEAKLEAYGKYRGIKCPKNTVSWVKRLEDVGSGSEISYLHIRVFAEYCKIPCGLLMLFSHVSGLVRKTRSSSPAGYDKDFVISFLDRTIRSLEMLRDKLSATADSNELRGLLLSENDAPVGDDKEAGFETNVEILEDLQKAFWLAGDDARVPDEEFHRLIVGNM